MNTVDKTAEMAASLTEDKKAATRVRNHLDSVKLINMLINLRNSKGMTQQQIADEMGVHASKVSRMESVSDDQIRWGDVVKYTKALRINLSLLVDDPSLPAALRIKHYVLTIHQLLEELRVLACKVDEGEELAAQIKEFYAEVLFNFMIRFSQSYDKLPQTGPINISSSPKTPPCPETNAMENTGLALSKT
jgi:transcriptional regulator with XRE-family HTH domain